MATKTATWRLERFRLAQLLLDWQNPRLPDSVQREDATQEELALFIDKHYDPLQIATSIAKHGYFESEPLIAVMAGSDALVVEGNRRLTALKGLADDALRAKFAQQNSGWSDLARTMHLPSNFPVVPVNDRAAVIPLLGFRHISGIEPWEPWAQARFIAGLVEQGQTLDEIAELVGRTLTEIRSMYRDHEILRQASEHFEIDTKRAEDSFGVFTAAMNRTKIRDYIGAPAPREVDTEHWPLPEDRKDNVDKLLKYIFGDEGGGGRVVHDSRQLKDLAEVLAEPTGTAEQVLTSSGSLADALQATQEAHDQFKSYVSNAQRNLKLAAGLDIGEVDPTTSRRLREISRLVEKLLLLASPTEEQMP